ncbi:DUF397 domain-containing protein [Actinomadura luteofluorescens]|uniref:DUF397 domain-containing protein n=1 Tax=Actinomadura luteofluorescens TaxID=46163 RepID=UPI003D8A5F2D
MTQLDPRSLKWRKSSYSGGSGGECVELAVVSGRVLVRDSKDSGGPLLRLTPAAARGLVSRLREWRA